MNLRRQLVLSLGLGILTLGLAATQARAQLVYTGTFDLPAPAYWANKLLAPGQYTIRLTPLSQTVSQIRVEGEGTRTDMLTTSGEPERKSSRSFLKIEEANGTFYISELSAGQIAKSFPFGKSKAVKERTLSSDASRSMTLPVTASGF